MELPSNTPSPNPAYTLSACLMKGLVEFDMELEREYMDAQITKLDEQDANNLNFTPIFPRGI